MHVAARARLVLARRPWIYWAIILALASVVAVTVHGQLGALDDARAQWGTSRRVVVAASDLEPGAPIATRSADLPEALIPAAALAELANDAILRQRVAEGEILTEVDIAARPGPAARAPAGTVVVAVPDPLAKDISLGAPVRIAADGLILAESATVADVTDGFVFVAVEPHDAAAVAAAAQQGLTTLLYLP